MRVAVVCTHSYNEPAKLSHLSGHVQIPLMTARLMSESGHDVTLLSTSESDDHLLPNYLPESVQRIRLPHPTRTWPAKGIRPVRLGSLVTRALAHFARNKYDVAHFFGGSGMLGLAYAVRLGTRQGKVIFSPISGLDQRQNVISHKVKKHFAGRINHIVCFTEYTAGSWKSAVAGTDVRVARPGITRESPDGVKEDRASVLFWRTPSYSSGIDVATRVAKDLCSEFPEVVFRFSLRNEYTKSAPMMTPEQIIEQVGDRPNIEIHTMPYAKPYTIEYFLDSALLCLMPFRKLSINPQLVVLETLMRGVPVVASGVESLPEYVIEGVTGYVRCLEEPRAFTNCVRAMLSDRERTSDISRQAAETTKRNWNWGSFEKSMTEAYEA